MRGGSSRGPIALPAHCRQGRIALTRIGSTTAPVTDALVRRPAPPQAPEPQGVDAPLPQQLPQSLHVAQQGHDVALEYVEVTLRLLKAAPAPFAAVT
jgi:hypothetical protein